MGIGDRPLPPVDYGPTVRWVARVLLKECDYAKNTPYVYILHADGLCYLRMRLPDGCVFQCDADSGAWMDLHSPDGERLHGMTLFNPTIQMVCAAARYMCETSIRTKAPVPIAEHEIVQLREMEGWKGDEDELY